MEKVNCVFEPFSCEACNQVRLFRTIPSWRPIATTAKLQKVYMDLFECDTESWNGERFFLVIVDDFSEYIFVYSLVSKKKVKEILKRVWLRRFEKQLTYLEIQSANGGKFIDKSLVKMLEGKGVRRKFGNSYGSNLSSGVVERKIRTIRERAELLISSLSHETAAAIYNEAVKHACQLVNHTPYVPGSISCPATKFESDCEPLPTTLFHFGETVNVACGDRPADVLYQAAFIGQDRSKKAYRVFSSEQRPLVNSVERIVTASQLVAAHSSLKSTANSAELTIVH